MTPQLPYRLFSIDLHGVRFRLAVSGEQVEEPGFARELDELLGTAMDVDEFFSRLPAWLQSRGALLSDVLDLHQPQQPVTLEQRIRTAVSGRNPVLSAALLQEAFADSSHDDHVALLQTVDMQWLQGSVRAVLDELDEAREQAIDNLRGVLSPELVYLLLT